MKVIVIGASGSIGRATLKALTSRHAENVEAFAGVRNIAKFGEMESVTPVQADVSDQASLTETLKSYDAAYLVVPGVENRTELALKGIQAAKDAKIKFLLVLSVATAGTDSIFGKQWVSIEEATKKSGLQHAIVRLPIFMENNFSMVESIKTQGTFYDPRNPNKPHTPVSVSDAGKASADILASPAKHIGKVYTLVSPAYSLNDMALEFSKELGKEVKPTTVPYPAAKQAFLEMGFPEWMTDGILELFKYIDEGNETTNQKQIGDFEAITGEKPITIQQWVLENAAAFK